MLKKTIEFKDYKGTKRIEDFYFNLTKAEVLEMEMGTVGGFAEYTEAIIKAQDQPTLIRLFKDVVMKSYGEKSLDGRRFIKSEQLSTEFSQTEAYSILYMELATNDEAASDFINGIVPADISGKKVPADFSGRIEQ